MDEQRETVGIALAVDDEHAGNASSHGEGAQDVAPPPGAKKRTQCAVGVVPRENFLNFKRSGRGVVRLALSLCPAPQVSRITCQNLSSNY